METAVLTFFKQENLLYIKWHLSEKSNTFQNLSNNITLLPAEKFGNIKLYKQKLSLKINYDFRMEISCMEK